jgi:hypothetical protein
LLRIGARDGGQHVLARGSVGGFAKPLEQRVEHAVENREEERALALEELEEVRLRDARLLGDRLRRGAVQSVQSEFRERRSQDQLPSLFCRHAAALGRAHRTQQYGRAVTGCHVSSR